MASERSDPAIEVRVPEAARYLGAERLLIDDRFDAELHVFAEADVYGGIERFYWFQFERYTCRTRPDGTTTARAFRTR